MPSVGLAPAVPRARPVIDVVGQRKRCYWIAAVVMLLLCITSLVFRGFNFGIEFKGGNSFRCRPASARSAEVAAGRRAGRRRRRVQPRRSVGGSGSRRS